jgi:DNA-3-methyladenine glycosylase II
MEMRFLRCELGRLIFSIDPVPPFRLDLTVWAIRRRRENAIDRWDGETYERVLAVGKQPALVSVRQSGSASSPKLHVTVRAARLSGSVKNAAMKTETIIALDRLLGLRVDLRPFYERAAQHSRLRALAARFQGLKPSRFPTVWEGLVNGIACQQFSLTVGILLLNRLTALSGLPFEEDDGRRAFPRPEDLAAATPESLRSLGFNGFKSRELIRLGRKIASGELALESFADLPNPDAAFRLLELPGVGRWTAEYVSLRGLGRIDTFPGDDIGARNNLARWLHLRKPLDYDRSMRIVDQWKPFAGLIYFHLLLDGLDRAGYLQQERGRAAG